jgi:hypothetical protein
VRIDHGVPGIAVVNCQIDHIAVGPVYQVMGVV